MPTSHMYVLYAQVGMFLFGCVFDLIVRSRAEGKPLCLPLTLWHRREIRALELPGYLFLTYPHSAYPYSIISPIWPFALPFASLIVTHP